MKIAFTKKMILDDESVENEFLTIFLRSYLNENFTENMLKIKFKDFQPNFITFCSYKYGTASWDSDSGIVRANSWETEDQLIEKSTLTKHFQSSFENSSVTDNYAITKIIPDTISALLDKNFGEMILDVVLNKNRRNSEIWKNSILNYKQSTNDFLENFNTKE